VFDYLTHTLYYTHNGDASTKEIRGISVHLLWARVACYSVKPYFFLLDLGSS